MSERAETSAANGVRFAVATRADESAIRRMLRENPLRGAISLTFEREPDYFAGEGLGGAEERTILAFEGGRVVCMGKCAVRDGYLNGRAVRIGYLGELRLDAAVRGRAEIVRRGYAFFRECAAGMAGEKGAAANGFAPVDFYFTSVSADNVRARRLLERGARGLPRYEALTEFATLLIPVPKRRRGGDRTNPRGSPISPLGSTIVSGLEVGAQKLAAFLDAEARRHQLASAWTEARVTSLARHGLPLARFRVVRAGAKIVACAALWDQREFRQTVIRGYAPWLGRVRPLANAWARTAGGARLPAVGETLANAFISPLAVEPGCEWVVPALIQALAPVAREAGVEVMTMGFSESDTRWDSVRRRLGGRVYRSRLYRVRWPGDGGEGSRELRAESREPEKSSAEPTSGIAGLDGRAFLPEVAWL